MENEFMSGFVFGVAMVAFSISVGKLIFAIINRGATNRLPEYDFKKRPPTPPKPEKKDNFPKCPEGIKIRG